MLIIDSDRNYAMSIVSKDTGYFTLSIEGYTLTTGDQITFTVNKAVELPDTPLIQVIVKEFDSNTNSFNITLTSEQTDLEPGNYVYDIQLNTADGIVDTIVGPSKFKVIGGVTY